MFKALCVGVGVGGALRNGLWIMVKKGPAGRMLRAEEWFSVSPVAPWSLVQHPRVAGLEEAGPSSLGCDLTTVPEEDLGMVGAVGVC